MKHALPCAHIHAATSHWCLVDKSEVRQSLAPKIHKVLQAQIMSGTTIFDPENEGIHNLNFVESTVKNE